MATAKQIVFLGTELKLNISIAKLDEFTMDDYDFNIEVATVEAGQPLPPIMVDMSDMMAAQQGTTGVSMNGVAIAQAFDTTGAMGTLGEGIPCLLVQMTEFGTVVVAEDGSITSMDGMPTMSLRQ